MVVAASQQQRATRRAAVVALLVGLMATLHPALHELDAPTLAAQ